MIDQIVRDLESFLDALAEYGVDADDLDVMVKPFKAALTELRAERDALAAENERLTRAVETVIARLGKSEWVVSAELSRLLAEAAPCRHCGKLPDADGDHSCPCPHRDEDCPDHPARERPTLLREWDELRAKVAAVEAAPEVLREHRDFDVFLYDSCYAKCHCGWRGPDRNGFRGDVSPHERVQLDRLDHRVEVVRAALAAASPGDEETTDANCVMRRECTEWEPAEETP